MSTRTIVEHGVQQFASGAISLDELRRLFTPLLVQGEVGPAAQERLATDLVHLFEDDSLDSAEHRVNAQRLTRFFSANLTEDEYRSLLRIVVVQDRLCDIIMKTDAGIVSRTSFVAFVGKARLPGMVKTFLMTAAPEQLRQFCENLRNVRTSEIRPMLRD